MFRVRLALARLKHRQLCTSTGKPNNNNKGISGDNGGDGSKQPSSLTRYNETYSQLGKLDFMTAAKIIFTEPSKKKFGLDFHLVQLFFACLPSLAVYLVAMYARREMEKYETDFQREKRKAEELKAKEEEQKAKELEAKSNAALSEMTARLEQLEVAVKEIAVAKKKHSTNEDQHVSPNNAGSVNSRSGSSKPQSGTPSK